MPQGRKDVLDARHAMVSLFKRLAMIVAIVESLAVVSSSALMQKSGATPTTIAVIISIIAVATVAIMANVIYWVRRFLPPNRQRV